MSTKARLAAVGDEFSIARRTKSIDDVLRMEDVDIVDICTPPALHVAQTSAALAAGKEVVCEKPLAGSLAEIDRMIAAEAEAAGRVMPVFQYRFGNGLQKAKRIIDLGIAGKPYLATVETAWKRTPEYYETPWRGRLDNRARRRVADPRDPFARSADLSDGPGRVGVCAHGDAGQPGRGRGLRGREPRHAERRARLARRHARLAEGDQPAALVLRARDVRELASALCSRRRSVADHPRITRSRRTHCATHWPATLRAVPLRGPDGALSRGARRPAARCRSPSPMRASHWSLSPRSIIRPRPALSSTADSPDHPRYNGWRYDWG